jgi:WD40 repeat protein
MVLAGWLQSLVPFILLMGGMPQRLRIFVSSPTDVPDERLRADLIVDKLSQDYGRFFTLKSYRWEHEAMLASKHFQDATELPSAFDIVVLILWSRLGTPLPEKTAEREYRGIDGRAPVTGTEWEFEEALKVAREKKAPDLLAFRNIRPAPIDPRDPDAQDRTNAQLKALNAFWTRHFVDRGVVLAAHDEYRTLEEFAEKLEGSLRRLIERRIKHAFPGEARTEPIWLGEPFRGLESYEFEHAPIFFGRNAGVTKATEQLAGNARSGRAFLLVSGASGSGKSSLVKAGIVPRLMKPQRISGMAFLRRAVFRPGSEAVDLFLGLSTALTHAVGQDVGLPELIAPGQDTTKLATHLRGAVGDPGYLFANALGRLTEAARQSGRLLAFEEAKLILVVDQLEELFVSGIAPDDRRLFIQLLAGLARSGVVWVIATLRADFWHRAAEIPQLVTLAEGQGRIDLVAPGGPELAEMIRKPAQAAGLWFEAHPESGLSLDVLVADDAAAAPGALPLLSFTLDELYKNAKAHSEQVLTYASYEVLGGLEGAIAKRADEIVAALPMAAQTTLPRVLRALTTVTGSADQAPIARPAQLEVFAVGTPARILIDAFIAARLLVAATEGGNSPTVRLAHEALISRWKRARGQLATDRRDLETRTLIEQQFRRWSQAHGRERPLFLLRNPDLANALDLAGRWGDDLAEELRSFVVLSDGAAKSAARRRWAIAAVVMVCLAGLSAALVGAFAVAERQRNDASIAQSRFLARDSRAATASGDATLGTNLALAALPRNIASPNKPFLRDAETALAYAANSRRELLVLRGHKSGTATFQIPIGQRTVTFGTVYTGVFSPDGKRIVTSSSDGTNRVWDAATGSQISMLPGVAGEIRAAVFSPDGQRVLAVSGQRFPILWTLGDEGKMELANKDCAEGGPQKIWMGPISPGIGSLSSDGGRAITVAYESRQACLWDTNSGKLIAPLSNSEGHFKSIQFSPDGERLISLAEEHDPQLWDGRTGRKVADLRGHEKLVSTAVFSRDSDHVITASADGTVRIWGAKTGGEIRAIRAHSEAVNAATFSPNGTTIATASEDKTVRLWDSKTGALLKIQRDLKAPLQDANLTNLLPVTSAVFSSDGHHLLTTSDDGAIRVWNTKTGYGSDLKGHEGKVVSAIFSPDEQFNNGARCHAAASTSTIL